jgi:hypothetical protein
MREGNYCPSTSRIVRIKEKQAGFYFKVFVVAFIHHHCLLQENQNRVFYPRMNRIYREPPSISYRMQGRDGVVSEILFLRFRGGPRRFVDCLIDPDQMLPQPKSL